MITVEVTRWENLEQIDAELLLEEIMAEGELAMKEALLELESVVKEKLTGQRSGRTYRVPVTKGSKGNRRLHVASAPGEPPASLFGNLRNSVGHDGPKRKGNTIGGRVGPGLGTDLGADEQDAAKGYARRLELGGVDSRGIRILPRPYMEPSVKEARPEINRIFETRVGSG